MGAGGEAPDLPFPVVFAIAAAFPLLVDAALASVARYSSGGSLVLFSLRSYDPTTTKLSLSAGSQKGTVSMLRRRTLHILQLLHHTSSPRLCLCLWFTLYGVHQGEVQCCSLHASHSAPVVASMLTSGMWEDIAEKEDMRENFHCYDASPPGEPLRCAWHLYWTSPASTSSCSLLAYRSQKPAAYPS